METVYLLHFHQRYKHIGHYTGSTANLTQRLDQHATGHGVRLLAGVQAAGITWANESYQITISPSVQYCIQVGSTCQYAADNATFEQGETKRKVAVNTSYITTHAPTVRSRLLKAGVRLGHILNGIWGTTE